MSDLLSGANSEIRRVEEALDDLDQTRFRDLEKTFDNMARDLSDAKKYLAKLEALIDEIEEE